MKASISTTSGGLKLKDLRRLVAETNIWSGECGIELLHAVNDMITVTEEDKHRQRQDVT